MEAGGGGVHRAGAPCHAAGRPQRRAQSPVPGCVLSDIQQTFLTNVDFFHPRAPSCRPLVLPCAQVPAPGCACAGLLLQCSSNGVEALKGGSHLVLLARPLLILRSDSDSGRSTQQQLHRPVTVLQAFESIPVTLVLCLAVYWMYTAWKDWFVNLASVF